MFFVLQEPETVSRMGYIGKYIAALFHGWAVSMSTAASLVLLFLPLVLPDKFKDSSAIPASYIWVASAICFVAANFMVWRREYKALEIERSVAPKIDISVLNIMTRGQLNMGLTDLFLYLELILQAPSQVHIVDYSLMIFNESASTTMPACEDLIEWQIDKWDNDNNLSYVKCVPLAKDLPRRGDPIQGWIHFPIPNVSEGAMHSYGFKIKLNCVHGTCYFALSTVPISSGKKRGVVRRVTHET